MPTFDKSKRYKNKKGQTFGKGVWLDDNGKPIPPGFGYEVNRDSRTVSQLNSDGTVTKYPFEEWAKKNDPFTTAESDFRDIYNIGLKPENRK